MTLMDEAYEVGRMARKASRMRVSPFYNEQAMIAGKWVDITPMLDAFWLAGFDGTPISESSDGKILTASN